MQNSRELERKPSQAEGHINKNSSKNSGFTSKKIIFLDEELMSSEITTVGPKKQIDMFN